MNGRRTKELRKAASRTSQALAKQNGYNRVQTATLYSRIVKDLKRRFSKGGS